MPSEKVLDQKKAVVASLIEKMQASKSAVLVDYRGITVEDDTKLRAKLRENNVDYFVAKNTLIRRAANELGYSELDPILNGTTAMALCAEDEIAPARVLNEYAKEHENFVFKGGIFEGKVVDAAFIKSIANLPSKTTLIAMTLGGLNAPITKLACVIKAIAEKKEAAEA
ncbi:MAG: 50S ribosomal protein L10 [Ruminococcaceae bacterium]|nr:50S ribosomal protein L10 [Oscillospiraceae bacterium]